MPHALALDRSQPTSAYPSARPTKPQHELQLPLRDPRSLYAAGESRQARPSTLGNPVTPPVNMTSVQRGHNALPQAGSSYAVQRAGDAAFVNKQQHVHQAPEPNSMTTSHRPAYQNGPHQPIFRPQSPSMRTGSSTTINNHSEDFKHARRASNHAIAPSLQIPSTINTPQSSMPQLAAEVILHSFRSGQPNANSCRSLASSGSKIHLRCTRHSTRDHHLRLVSYPMRSLRLVLENGSLPFSPLHRSLKM